MNKTIKMLSVCLLVFKVTRATPKPRDPQQWFRGCGGTVSQSGCWGCWGGYWFISGWGHYDCPEIGPLVLSDLSPSCFCCDLLSSPKAQLTSGLSPPHSSHPSPFSSVLQVTTTTFHQTPSCWAVLHPGPVISVSTHVRLWWCFHPHLHLMELKAQWWSDEELWTGSAVGWMLH